MEIFNIFPTAIGKFALDREFTDAELKFINNLETRPNTGNVTSSNNYILKCKELASINKFANSCVKKYFEEIYQPKYNVKPYITQSWSNYTKAKEFHHAHSHQNSFISGVLYINADPQQDKIKFSKNKYEQLWVQPNQWNLYNSDTWWLPVESRILYLFPSSLTHMVETVTAKETRVSIAFNTFLKGNLGDNLQLTEVIL